MPIQFVGFQIQCSQKVTNTARPMVISGNRFGLSFYEPSSTRTWLNRQWSEFVQTDHCPSLDGLLYNDWIRSFTLEP